MKLTKRILSIFLVILMAFGTEAYLTSRTDFFDGVFTQKSSAATMKQTISSMKVGDLITYGSYPQTDVTSSMGSTLTAAAPSTDSWTSYNYYEGGTQSDYMKYYDLKYGSDRYRGVYFSKYRPSYWNTTSTAYQSANGYKTGTVYWFRYDPLTWRILDPKTGYVICENIIDSQAFNDEYYSHGTDAYGYTTIYNDKTYTHLANNWEYSTIRKWLNETFYTTAFSSSERSQIPCTKHTTPAYSNSYSAYDVGETGDYVFLPTYQDMLNTSYGFSSDRSAYDINRRAHSSDYAKSQGVAVYKNSLYQTAKEEDTSWYRLRSAGDFSCGTPEVEDDGYVYYRWDTSFTDRGIRPALHFNPSSIGNYAGDNKTDALSQNYINEHIKFIASTDYKNLSKQKYNFAYDMIDIKTTAEYKWDNFINLDFFRKVFDPDKYYKVALSELISRFIDETLPSASVEYTGKEYVELGNDIVEIIKGFIDMSNVDLSPAEKSDDAITKFLSNETDKNSPIYKALKSLFKVNGDAEKKFYSAMVKLDKIGQVKSFVSTGLDIIDGIKQFNNYLCVLNAYKSLDDDLKTAFKTASSFASADSGNQLLAKTMYNFVNADSGISKMRKEVFTEAAKVTADSIYKLLSLVYKKKLLSTLAIFSEGIKLGGVTISTVYLEKAGGISIKGAASAVTTGLALGTIVSNILTGADKLAEEMNTAVALGQMSSHFQSAMNLYKVTLEADNDLQSARLFDRAYLLYKTVQLYAYDQWSNIMQTKEKTVVASWKKEGKKTCEEAVEYYTNEKNKLSRINCHKIDISTLDFSKTENKTFVYKSGEQNLLNAYKDPTVWNLFYYGDCTATCSENQIGTAKITLTGKGNYFKGKKVIKFTIIPAQVKSLKQKANNCQSYTLSWNSVPGNVEYEVVFVDTKVVAPAKNTKVIKTTKTNSATISEKKDFTGSVYKIRAFKTVDGKKYYGSFSKSIVIKLDGHKYSSWKTIKEGDCVNAEKQSRTCSVCNYVETRNVKVSHNYKNVVTKAATQTKDGKITPTCPGCRRTKTAVTIPYAKTFTLSKTSFTYNGKVQKPTVTVKDKNGNKISSSYYTVTYPGGMKNVGKYNVKITFKGRYSGTKSLSYKIIPKGTTIKSVDAKSKGMTVTVYSQKAETTGYEIQLGTSSKFDTPKSIKFANSKTSTTITKLAGAKKYYIRVRTYKTINGTTFYSSWSSAKSVTTKK